MIPTALNVFDKCREVLGDTEVAGGQIWTNTRLLPALSLSHQKLYSELAKVNSDLLSREAFYLVSAYQQVFTLVQAGLSSVEEVSQLWSRVPSHTLSVTGVANGSDYADLTVSSTSNWSDGDNLDAFGFVGVTGCDGEWMADVQSSTVIRIKGASPSGAWSSGGTLVKSSSQWGDSMRKEVNTQNFSSSPVDCPARWCRQHHGIRIEGPNQSVELKLGIKISGGEISSASDSLGIDGSQLYHVAWVVCHVAGPKGKSTLVDQYSPVWQDELTRMKMEAVKDNQLSQRYRRPPYRAARRRAIGL